MKKLNIPEIKKYVEGHIREFHQARLNRLQKLKLNTVLKRKNPYLFKAKNILQSQDLIKSILDAYLSSQEETLFGTFLEELAIFVCSKVYGGKKSSAEGIDLEFEKDTIHYIVSIKSGPNWGNSQQIKKMESSFKKAKQILKTSNVKAVNGCCYGQDKNSHKGEYHKLCGQKFWKLISGNKELYIKIIEPLGHKAK